MNNSNLIIVMLKKLLISALIAASAIFATSCKKDDGQIVPVDITVSAEEVIIDSIPTGPVQITLKSNRPWSVDIQVENPWGDENANWITVDPQEGGQTEGQVITLTAQKNVTDSVNYERAVRIYFRTDKQIFASVRVYQKGVTKPNAWVYKSVKELRDIAKDLDRNTTDAIDIKEPWIVKGIVISSGSNPQTVSSKNLFIQDETAGILLYTDAYTNFAFGDEVEVKLKGGNIKYYYQLLQFTPENTAMVSGTGRKEEPKATLVENGEDFVKGTYESMYVKMTAQVVSSDLEKTMADSPVIETEDGASFLMYTRSEGPSWSTQKVPQGAGTVYGLCNSFSGVYQLVPQREKDFAEMTGARFTGKPAVTTGEAQLSDNMEALLSGSFVYEGEVSDITEAGFYWKKSENEEYSELKADAVSESFTATLTGLEKGATYSFKAYVKIGERCYEGSEKLFITSDETILTVAQFVEVLKTLESGSSLINVGTYVEGIVVGDGDGGNLNKALAVADAAGEANSGMYIYDKDGAFVNDFNIGDKVRIRLAGAKLDIYNELREIVWDSYSDDIELISSGNSFTIPQITAAQFNSGDYQAMRVEVINLQSKNGQGAVWNDGTNNNVNTIFADDSGEEIAVRTYKGVSWAKNIIADKVEASISGVASCYGTTQQLFPVVESDIAAFNIPITFNTFEISLSEDNSTVDFLLEYELKSSAELTTVNLFGETGGQGVLELEMTAGSPITYSIDINELQRGATYNFFFSFVIDDQTYHTEGKSFFVPELEETTITVKELVTRLLDTEDGASLASVATYVEGYVAGYNQDQNLFKCLAVVDNTGEEYSGVMLYGQDEFNTDFQIGDKVRISLANAYYSPYNGLRQVKFTSYEKGVDIEVIESGATIQDVNISAAEFLTGAHQAMRVSVIGITAKADYVSKQWLNKPLFTDGSNEFYVETYKTSSWAEEYISDATGTVRGIHYGTSLKPQTKSDIDEALFGSAPSDVITPVPLPSDFDPTTANFDILSAMSAPGSSHNKADGNTGDINGSETITILKLDPRKAQAYLEAPVPAGVAGATKLSMVAVSWKGDSAEIIVTIKNGGTINGQESISFTAPSNDGASSTAPFHLNNLTEYYEFTLDGITDESVIRIEAKSKRALVAAVNFE